MSLFHVKNMLNNADEMRHWIKTSKMLRLQRFFDKSWVQEAALHTLLFSSVATSFMHLNTVPASTPVNYLFEKLFAAGFAFTLVGFVVIGVCLGWEMLCSRRWNAKTAFTGARNFDYGLKMDPIYMTAPVIENFMKMKGEEWDELAPILNRLIETNDLPFMWWEDLNAHIVNAFPVATPKVESKPEPVIEVAVEPLEEQLQRRAQYLKNTNNSLII